MLRETDSRDSHLFPVNKWERPINSLSVEGDETRGRYCIHTKWNGLLFFKAPFRNAGIVAESDPSKILPFGHQPSKGLVDKVFEGMFPVFIP